jgi:hypothetical protein
MAHIKQKLAGALALLALILLSPASLQPAFAQASPSGDSFQGFLTAVWGDPHTNAQTGGVIQFTLTYPNGARVALDVAPDLQAQAIQANGKRVTVRGSAISSQRVQVNAIEVSAIELQKAVTGTKKVLFILLKFQGDDQTPHPINFFDKLTNPNKGSGDIPATINGFFDAVSYGKFKWKGAVAGGKWYTLPKSRTQYANCGASGACFAPVLNQIGDDALNLVRNDVDVDKFDNINFVFNNDLDCCAWGGGYSNGGRFWGATWEPPWGQETSTYVHEMGHSLGLPHSGWRYFAYDSGHDEMSRGSPAKSVECGVYNSVNFGGPNTSIFCNEPGGGYITAHQDFLGWIPGANKAVHDTKNEKTYEIEANSLPLGNKLKMVVVCLKGESCSAAQGDARYITIEVKSRTAKYDRAVPSEGVIIHDVLRNRPGVGGSCYFNSQSGWAMPFDATPGDYDTSTCSGEGLRNMAYGVGKTFNDKSMGVKVKVVSKKGDVYTVKVTKSK